MSSDTITTALFLITAVVAAAVLINAIFPVIYTMTGTFSSSSHAADERLRTDLKIINAYAHAGSAQIWIKNVGTNRISGNEINQSDIFIGAPTDFESVPKKAGSLGGYGWDYIILGDTNRYWDPAETVHLTIESSKIPTISGDIVYFQFVSQNGVVRSAEFSASG
ncbi:MAG: flagellin [Methanomicrobiales archaeon]|nr:flagellin [Methanomicrobiales archaeon]MDI6877334.1 flagellin [Methanomicrobiales archaeon]